MAVEEAWSDSDMFLVVNAELLRAEVLHPALTPVKDLKAQAGISQTWR